MIVQLIGTKYVKICERRTDRQTDVPDRCTDGHTDMNHMSPVRGIRPAGTITYKGGAGWRDPKFGIQ